MARPVEPPQVGLARRQPSSWRTEMITTHHGGPSRAESGGVMSAFLFGRFDSFVLGFKSRIPYAFQTNKP